MALVWRCACVTATRHKKNTQPHQCSGNDKTTLKGSFFFVPVTRLRDGLLLLDAAAKVLAAAHQQHDGDQ